MPYDLPALWRGEPFGMLRAKVIAVRFGDAAQRAQNSHRVSVDVGERRNRPAGARHFAAGSRIHVSLSLPTADGAARHLAG